MEGPWMGRAGVGSDVRNDPGMAIHIAGVSLPGPLDLLEAVRAVTGWGVEATEILAELPGRASILLAEVERLVRRINDVAERADRLVDKVDAVATAASQ